MATSPARTDRWKALDFGPPVPDAAEPDLPVLVEYMLDERVAVITLNRPHADNAITTAMGARLTEILETIAVRPAVRAVILTGASQRAFSVGSDLRQRNNMTKEGWLRQRQDFDRTLYTVRQLRKPIFTAVNGIAYGGGCELAQSTDFIIASGNATFGQPEAMVGLAAGGGSPALLPRLLPPGKAMQMLMTGDPISAQEDTGWAWSTSFTPKMSSSMPPIGSRGRSRVTHPPRYRPSSRRSGWARASRSSKPSRS